MTKPLLKTVVRSAKTIGKKAIKSASKHGLKKVAKEIAKDIPKDIAKDGARLGTEKVLEGIDTIANKAKQKGAPAQKTDTVTAAIRKTLKNAGDSLSKSAAEKIESGIDKLIPTADTAKKRKRKAVNKLSSSSKVKRPRKSLINIIEED